MTFDPETNRILTCLLTPEELAALRAAKHGWEWSCGADWEPIYDPSWLPYAVYRALPEPVTKPHVPNEVWAVLGPEWRWIVLTDSGTTWLDQARPILHSRRWEIGRLAVNIADLFPTITRGTCDWREAICERPEGV